jgi:hypothetical protein
MGIFRYDSKYAAPTKEQRERYMKGESTEIHFGEEGEIMVIDYPEAAYLKDEIDGVRILITGVEDKARIYDEVKLLLDKHQQKVDPRESFTSAGEI